jgi:hypothetical protein
MFQFLIGVAFGAAGYWAWQSFGRDLLGMGSDQETTYGGFSGGSTSTGYSPTSTSSGSSTSSDPTSPAGGSTGSVESTA